MKGEFHVFLLHLSTSLSQTHKQHKNYLFCTPSVFVERGRRGKKKRVVVVRRGHVVEVRNAMLMVCQPL